MATLAANSFKDCRTVVEVAKGLAVRKSESSRKRRVLGIIEVAVIIKGPMVHPVFAVLERLRHIRGFLRDGRRRRNSINWTSQGRSDTKLLGNLVRLT